MTMMTTNWIDPHKRDQGKEMERNHRLKADREIQKGKPVVGMMVKEPLLGKDLSLSLQITGHTKEFHLRAV